MVDGLEGPAGRAALGHVAPHLPQDRTGSGARLVDRGRLGTAAGSGSFLTNDSTRIC